jgi:hypothetical protein
LTAAVLVAVSVWMLCGKGEDEDRAGRRILPSQGWAVVGIAVSVSLDDPAIGFTLGLARLRIAAVIVVIAVQALSAAPARPRHRCEGSEKPGESGQNRQRPYCRSSLVSSPRGCA